MCLAGNPIILLSLLIRNGSVSATRILLLIIYFSKTFLSLIFGIIEWIFFSRKIENTKISEHPVFILGHYRSGTTLLQKLLICDNNFGSIKYLDVFCPVSAFLFPGITRKWLQFIIRIFQVKNIFFNNMVLRLDDPGEEDLYMISGCSEYSTAWGFVFPRAITTYFDRWTTFDNYKNKKKWARAYTYYLKRITLKNNHKALILKSPPNTARIKSLLEMFPDARFIYIYRNPYRVFYSMQNLWNNVIEKHFALQNISNSERKESIFNIYLKLMDQFEKDKGFIPAGNLIEIRYEDLENDPIHEIKRIYASFGIQGYDHSIENIEQRLEIEKKYSPLTYQYDQNTLDEVYERWAYFIDKWNYESPQTEISADT
jgi:omega-hydroxy-beta-dihydromenaquinone-9 sulfotransferase